jgi:hypothetical protein
MAAMFNPKMPPIPQAAPIAPSVEDPDVALKTEQALKNEKLRQGRASTFLTDPKAQRTAQANAQTYLTGL